MRSRRRAPRADVARLSPTRRRALELLASSPNGATKELLVVVNGFGRDMIAGLVRTGLATADREIVKARGNTIKVVRITITDAGRRALAENRAGRVPR
jgi:hypothetical protein